MHLLEISPNQFINTNEVVLVTYEPATTGPGKTIDRRDYGIAKIRQTAVESSLKICLSTGQELVYYGAEAEAVYAKIRGRPVSKLAP